MPYEWATTAERAPHTYDVPRKKLLIDLSEVVDYVRLLRYRSYLAINLAGDIIAYEIADHNTQRANPTGQV
jgi:hypothetical protein